MRTSTETFYNIQRLHAIFAVAALAMLAVTVWMVAADHRREWKRYQRTFRDQIEPEADEAAARLASENPNLDAPSRSERAAPGPSRFTQWLLGLPLIDALARPLAIEQIWLPDLTIDYHFCQVARFDRCTTCHQGITKGWPEEIGGRLPHPYRPHPRLDLYCGPHSPHPVSEFGCTICHDGQGSATEFRFASHAPNDPRQRAEWRQSHGWFWNHDWDLPMRPKRFLQSNCLKCHHEVSELEPSSRFPEPPAGKLLAGYHLVRRLGCFGCHELNGFDESGRRIGPDLRLEPNVHEVALRLLADPKLEPTARGLAQRVIARPDDVAARRQLADALKGSPRPESRVLAGMLATENPRPGTMRKVGPSLRDVAERLDAAAIVSRIADPAAFRPATRMPRMFGMHEHLEGLGLESARRFEPIEIRAMAEYLLAASQPIASLEAAAEGPSAERGKRWFRLQGCLACHQHRDFPESQATQGPDLSRLAVMFQGPKAAAWLTSWIRDPARHSPRTSMPGLLLNMPSGFTSQPKGQQSAGEAGSPRVEDAAADIAAYLLSSKDGELPALPPLVESDLDELALVYLRTTFSPDVAARHLREGIPASMAAEIPPDAAELLGPMTPADRLDKKLRYVGRRSIRKRGCFGCHDVPGMEDAAGIGPALSGWGRKPQSQLAFEQVAEFLDQRQGMAEGGENDDSSFYREAVREGRREGFVWQKLRAPRSFDFRKASGKPYNEHLLMGRFSLTEAEREAIITFVLGLVAEPPKPSYVFHPAEPTEAIVEGRKVLDHYGCAQCHTLELERWTIEYDPTQFPSPPPMPEHDFILPKISEDERAASLKVDRRGLARVELVGMPQVDGQGKLEETEDDDGDPRYVFTLWEPAVIAGKVWPVGGAGVLVAPKQIVAKRPPRGGDFARLLYPVALAEAKAAGSTAAGSEAWGWVPPPLVHEGRMVRPAWLYDYLLAPRVIRPAAVLQMPNFALSPAEARKLVGFFAAAAGAEFPYDSDEGGRGKGRVAIGPKEIERMDRAMRLVTDRTTYCAKCHLVGDFSPGGEIRTTLAPNLQDVAARIRPEFLRRWLASPKSVLPYTAMPVNFPPDQRLGQDIFPGSSVEQLDAVMELLLNYDEYVRRRVSIRQWIEAAKKP